MEEPPGIPDLSFLDLITEAGLIMSIGFWSLLILIILGCVLLFVPPRSGRRMSFVDLFAACFHIQILVFFLCVPWLLTVGSAMSGGSPQTSVSDMLMAGIWVLIDFTIGGTLLLLLSLRHRKAPTIEWSPALSILASIISLSAAWHCKIAASVLLGVG